MTETKHTSLSKEKFLDILDKIPSVKVGLIGDGCIDVYWQADMTRSEISKETPHFPLPVVEERFSLGAAGNVAANIKALGVTNFSFVTCIGNDWRKSIFDDIITELKIGNEHIIVDDKRKTPAYCKALRKGISNVIYEDPRIDFENFEPISSQIEEKIIERIRAVSLDVDIIVVSDQFLFGCISNKIREELSNIAKNKVVVVDSRNNIGLFENVIIKPNELECGKLLSMDVSIDNISDVALLLAKKDKSKCIVTLGKFGAVWIDNENYMFVPALEVNGPIDIVGAGDAFLAGFSCAFATGCSGEDAVEFANYVSSITIQKLNTTGTASAQELLSEFDKRNKYGNNK